MIYLACGVGSCTARRLQLTLRYLGGTVGIAMSSAILLMRTNAHFSVLAADLTESRGVVREVSARVAERLGEVSGEVSRQVVKELWAVTYVQAQTMSYADVFRLIMAAFLVAGCLVPLMSGRGVGRIVTVGFAVLMRFYPLMKCWGWRYGDLLMA